MDRSDTLEVVYHDNQEMKLLKTITFRLRIT